MIDSGEFRKSAARSGDGSAAPATSPWRTATRSRTGSNTTAGSRPAGPAPPTPRPVTTARCAWPPSASRPCSGKNAAPCSSTFAADAQSASPASWRIVAVLDMPLMRGRYCHGVSAAGRLSRVSGLGRHRLRRRGGAAAANRCRRRLATARPRSRSWHRFWHHRAGGRPLAPHITASPTVLTGDIGHPISVRV